MPAPSLTHERTWSLFADWCAAADLQSLPAAASTVRLFLVEMPTGRSTRLARLAAIRLMHADAGWPDPLPAAPSDLTPDPVLAELLSAVTTQSWPAGAVGRRDGFLLAVYAGLRLTRPQIRALTAADLAVGDGWSSVAGRRLVRADTSPGACPVCAVTRWLRILSIIEQPGGAGWFAVKRQLAGLWVKRAGEAAQHDCSRPLGAAWRRSHMLLPSIDRWGRADREAPLTIRSISTISLDKHRSAERERLTVYEPEPAKPEVPKIAAIDPERAAQILAETKADLAELDPLMDRLDAEIAEALARSAALLG